MPWSQSYDPLDSRVLSTLVAALPIVVLLASLAFLRIKAHWAALMGLAASGIVAVAVFHMPPAKAGAAALLGVATGLVPIGWIILNVIFLYTLAEEKGLFQVLQDSLTGITEDCRLQLLLIAFCFGAFFEGAAGFGTPVAVTAAILIGLGFSPLAASGLSLIANTAPVAFAAIGTPIIALSGVTGIDAHPLGVMVGRQLPFFAILIPAWMVCAFAGLRGMWEVFPAVVVAGVSFALPQFLISNFHGPWLVDIVASVLSMAALAVFLRWWRPARVWRLKDGVPAPDGPGVVAARHSSGHSTAVILRAWMPWAVLSLMIFLWALPQVRGWLDGLSCGSVCVPGLDKLIERVPPVVAEPALESAVYRFNWLSTTGTGIFIAALIAAFAMGYRPAGIAHAWWRTLVRVRFSLMTVAAMIGIGFLTRYSGMDATMGLSFAETGVLYPFFGTMLGWLGVALTGSDTASNVLFGNLQVVTAGQTGVSPTLMAAANSSGGVMGKMIDAQSIVVASTTTKWYGHEGDILRFIFLHSLALAALVGLLVMLQAYVFPFTLMVVR